jgi:hypothetical protein
VVVVVDGEPVDRQAGNLVERREALGDLGTAEQLGQRVRLVLVETDADLGDLVGVLGVAEGDALLTGLVATSLGKGCAAQAVAEAAMMATWHHTRAS